MTHLERSDHNRPSVITPDNERVTIRSFNQLCHDSKIRIERILVEAGLTQKLEIGSFDNIQIPRTIEINGEQRDLGVLVEAIVEEDRRKSTRTNTQRDYPDGIDFEEVKEQATRISEAIESKSEELVAALTKYETHEVARDEIERVLDLLKSLEENEEYFRRRVGCIGTFLPINQPLYALGCFAMVPALMANKVLARPPVVARSVFSELTETIELEKHFRNLSVSNEKRGNFVARCRSEKAEVIIFTGKMENAYEVRKSFKEDVLFIVNGAGHNPIVVSEDADLEPAITSTLRVQLYNQGQDCANPSSILVHRAVADDFRERLREAVGKVVIGNYSNPEVRVGPISNPKDIGGIVELLQSNRAFLDPSTPGVIRVSSGIVEPTIINRPLRFGGNYDEQLAPVFFLQEYETDQALGQYFERDAYSQNAMYISLFGNSEYVDSLPNHHFSDGRQLHEPSQIIRNKDLHAKGVERGTQPYGGYGRRASCLVINGRFIPKPTLPQRDIFENLVEPVMSKGNDRGKDRIKAKATRIRSAVERTLVLGTDTSKEGKTEERRAGYAESINDPQRLERIREFRKSLESENISAEEMMDEAYRAGRLNGGSPKAFFKDIYNLLVGNSYGLKLSTLIEQIGRQRAIELLNV